MSRHTRENRCLTSPSICTALLILLATRQCHASCERFGLARYGEDREAFGRLLKGVLDYVPKDFDISVRVCRGDVIIPDEIVGSRPALVPA